MFILLNLLVKEFSSFIKKNILVTIIKKLSLVKVF